MDSRLRCLFLALLFFGLWPISGYAQGTAQEFRLGGAISPNAGGGDSSSPSGLGGAAPAVGVSGGAVLPSIRQARPGRLGVDARTQQPLQSESPAVLERIEFQDFVAQSIGRDLPIFGSDLFKNVPSTFAPVDDIPVTSNYVIGPGDEILIRAWGQIDLDSATLVDRNGTINIPKVGTISVAGIKYRDLQAFLKTSIGRSFRNFELSVSLGQLRAIQVFVVGQARRPGSYTVSSMSTLVNAIFASGGPSAKGSMRAIQLKRGNNVVTEFDLYDLLITGDKSKDVPLLPGDVIYVPPVGALAAISGSVNVPAIFELKKAGTLADLIAWAGGLASTASGQKAAVERIDDRKTRKVDEFNLDAVGTQTELRDGDLVTIYPVAPRIENAVSLRGNVAQPVRVPWRQGMRIKDLIPQKEALLSRDYWLRKNQSVGLDNAIAGIMQRNQAVGVDIPVADLLRKNQQSPQQEAELTLADSMRRTQIAADVATVNADLFRKLPAPGASPNTPQNTPAAPQNNQPTPIVATAQRSIGLGIGQGSQVEGRDDKVKPKFADEIKRNLSEVNWNYAVIERFNPNDLRTSLVPFHLGKAILLGDPAQNLLLQPGDVVTIFSVDDIQVPIEKQTKYVRLEGEFTNPGIYSAEPGETLRQLIARVGGLSRDAYLFGAEFRRESTRIFQQKKLEESINRLEREIQGASISLARNALTPEEASSQDAAAQRTLIANLRQIKATGRIVLELPADDSASLANLPDLVLEDSDRLIVPSKPSTINVVGAVYNENAFVYRQEKRLADYLRQAGGVARSGDKADLYLLRVDGSVTSKRQSGWLMGDFDTERLMPGDTIVVPEDFARTSWTKTLRDWSQILYQMGLGVAALKVLRQ